MTMPPPRVITVPNAISALRLPLAALFPLTHGSGRIVVVAVAAASDWIDGRIARRTGRTSTVGAVIDPVADKIFALVALVTLTLEGSIPVWTLPLLLTRDIGVVAGALLLVAGGRRAQLKARRAGKAVTWLQFAAIATLIVLPSSAVWLAPVVAVAGIVALVDYARAARRSSRRR